MEDADLVRFQYAYDPETGEWLWRNPSERAERAGAKPGMSAGAVDHRDGARQLNLRRKTHTAARLAWLYMHGEWPTSQVLYLDPRLPLPDRDRLANLRLAGQKREITQNELKAIVIYDPDSGIFHWRVARKGIRLNEPAGSVKVTGSGAPVGSKRGRGYRYLTINGVPYMAQQLAWLYIHGDWPKARLTFKNGDQLDCRIENIVEGEFAHGTRHDAPLSFEERKRRSAVRYRKADLKRDFGISVAEYQEMHVAQHGLCAICGEAETKERNGKVKWLAVDHHHDSGAVRGLLCQNCNHMIGHSRERIDILEAAIAYLRQHERKEDAA